MKLYGYIEEINNDSFRVTMKEEGKEDMVYVGNIPIKNIPEKDREFLVKYNFFTLILDDKNSGHMKLQLNKNMWTEEELKNHNRPDIVKEED